MSQQDDLLRAIKSRKDVSYPRIGLKELIASDKDAMDYKYIILNRVIEASIHKENVLVEFRPDGAELLFDKDALEEIKEIIQGYFREGQIDDCINALDKLNKTVDEINEIARMFRERTIIELVKLSFSREFPETRPLARAEIICRNPLNPLYRKLRKILNGLYMRFVFLIRMLKIKISMIITSR